MSRLPAATPSAARRREPRRTSTTLPDIRPASASLQGPELPRVTWMLAGHVLKAYIMRPHLSTTAIHAVNGNYVLASEHGQGARSAQYYQDQALGYLAAYATEQHPGFIPPDTSRYLLEKAHQACRTLVIKQATAPESVIEVTEACYQALSQQAEQLVQQFAPTLRTIAEELDASERRHDLRLDEATLATFFARLDHGLPRPVDAAA